jgi:mannose-6-phosphate isomerase-like protein (cupin superfamily)
LSYRFDSADAQKFIDYYFSDVRSTFLTLENISPKFLVVMPGARLSWQYHNFRREVWRVVEGPMAIKISDTDEQPDEQVVLPVGGMVQFEIGQRHRLIGLDDWGIVA